MRSRLYLNASICGFLMFLLLAANIKSHSAIIQTFDQMIMGGFSLIESQAATHFFAFISHLFSPLTMSLSVIAISFVYFWKTKVFPVWIVVLFFGGGFLGLVFKHLVERTRPDSPLIPDTGFSFPSGHALCVFLLVLIIFRFVQSEERLGHKGIIMSVSVLTSLMVVVSRVYLRNHYPSDILGSLLLSLSWYWAVIVVESRYRARLAIKHTIRKV